MSGGCEARRRTNSPIDAAVAAVRTCTILRKQRLNPAHTASLKICHAVVLTSLAALANELVVSRAERRGRCASFYVEMPNRLQNLLRLDRRVHFLLSLYCLSESEFKVQTVSACLQ